MITGVVSLVDKSLTVGVGGSIVSTTNSPVPSGETLSRLSFAVAIITYVLSLNVEELKDHNPLILAVTVYIVPSMVTVMIELASAVPLIVGVLSFVTKSLIVGAGGGVVSISKTPFPSEETFPN